MPNLERVLRWCAHKYKDANYDMQQGPFLIKMTMPRDESRMLLRLLRSTQTWAATIFPNYDAVVAGIEERSHWK